MISLMTIESLLKWKIQEGWVWGVETRFMDYFTYEGTLYQSKKMYRVTKKR